MDIGNSEPYEPRVAAIGAAMSRQKVIRDLIGAPVAT